MFSFLTKENFQFSVTSILLTANAINVEKSINLPYCKELTRGRHCSKIRLDLCGLTWVEIPPCKHQVMIIREIEHPFRRVTLIDVDRHFKGSCEPTKKFTVDILGL